LCVAFFGRRLNEVFRLDSAYSKLILRESFTKEWAFKQLVATNSDTTWKRSPVRPNTTMQPTIGA